MDNAKIHIFKDLEDAWYQCGTILIYLLPYSPELNLIEVCFGQLKRWIQNNTNLAFPLYPELVLDVAMRAYTKDIKQGTLGMYGHCGYDDGSLQSIFFEELQNLRED